MAGALGGCLAEAYETRGTSSSGSQSRRVSLSWPSGSSSSRQPARCPPVSIPRSTSAPRRSTPSARRTYSGSKPSSTAPSVATGLATSGLAAGETAARRVRTTSRGRTLRVRLPDGDRPDRAGQRAFLENASRLGEALLEGECPDGRTPTESSRVGSETRSTSTRAAATATPGILRARHRPIEAWLPRGRPPRRSSARPTRLPRSCSLEFRPASLRGEAARPACRRGGRAAWCLAPGRRRHRLVRGVPRRTLGLPVARVVVSRYLPVLTAARCASLPAPGEL